MKRNQPAIEIPELFGETSKESHVVSKRKMKLLGCCVHSGMDICTNFLVFFFGVPCPSMSKKVNHILMMDSLLHHMKRTALLHRTILLWKNTRTLEEQDPPRINKTNRTHIISYFRDCIQYHDIHTVYLKMVQLMYSCTHVLKMVQLWRHSRFTASTGHFRSSL